MVGQDNRWGKSIIEGGDKNEKTLFGEGPGAFFDYRSAGKI